MKKFTTVFLNLVLLEITEIAFIIDIELKKVLDFSFKF